MSIKLYVNTRFSSKDALLSHIKKAEFFYNFIKILRENPKSRNHKFNPSIKKGDEVSFPQSIIYSEIPNFNLPFMELLEIDVHQKWYLNDDNFECNIKVYLKDNQIIHLKLLFRIHSERTIDGNIILAFYSLMIDKVFFIPDIVLENITNQVKIIISKLL